MKIRRSFVSNSSSASFILDRHKLTKWQEFIIEYHLAYFNEAPPRWYDKFDVWSIEILDHVIKCSAFMDNLDLLQLVKDIGAEDAIIEKWHS